MAKILAKKLFYSSAISVGSVISFILCLLAFYFAVSLFTPSLTIWFVRKHGVLASRDYIYKDFAHLSEDAQIKKDLIYPSIYSRNEFDIYHSSSTQEAKPTIFWMHGGAYIDGNKEVIKTYAVNFVAEGYTVISLNYALAPENKYPAPLIQLSEAYRYLETNKSQFPMIDFENVIFGGNSAGAQIAAQFVAIQVNDDLASRMNFTQVVKKDTIKATLLYSGPYNLKAFEDTGNPFVKFLFHQVGWAYLGDRNWLDTDLADFVTVPNIVTSNFPPTFITDGNYLSFQEQGMELHQKMKELEIETEALFFDKYAGNIIHDFQFDFNKYTHEARLCLERSINFLNRNINLAV